MGVCPICRKDVPRNPGGGEVTVVDAEGIRAPMHTDCEARCDFAWLRGHLTAEAAANRTIPHDEVMRRMGAWKREREQQSHADSFDAAPSDAVVAALSSRWQEAISDVRSILSDAPETLKVHVPGDSEPLEVEFVPALEQAQVGYSHSPDGESLTGGEGAWREEWLVVGLDALVGDPVFLDLSDPAFPVYRAAHGGGAWEPERLAPSLRALIP